MSEPAMPFVAVVGGFYELDDSKIADVKRTAREIGSALAEAGFGLVVYFSDELSLEPHVVSGYVEKLPPGRGAGSIRVRYPESQRDIVRFDEQATRSDVFEPKLFAGPDWEAPFYRSLVEAEGVNAVLLMAGGKSTLHAGQIALARPLPVLAIDTFGGAAGTIWTELAQTKRDYPSASMRSPAQLVAWLKEQCDAYVRRKEELRRMEKVYATVTAQTRKSAWASVAFVALLGTLLFGMTYTPAPALYPFVMFSGLIAAGATGALVRAIIWSGSKTTATTSLLLGAIAGFVVGLAYLIPQWIGAPGVLEASATEVEATDKIQFASSVLVAFSAGVGFDTVFTRLKKQAEDVPTSGPG